MRLGKRDKVTSKTQVQGTVEETMNPEKETFPNEKRNLIPHFWRSCLEVSKRAPRVGMSEWENK